jgi:hypothetical protein
MRSSAIPAIAKTTGEVRLDEREGGPRGAQCPKTCNRRAQHGHGTRAGRLALLVKWHASIESSLHPANAGQEVSCISCGACLMDCESFAVNPDFLGPQALAQAYRYAADPSLFVDCHLTDLAARCGYDLAKLGYVHPNQHCPRSLYSERLLPWFVCACGSAATRFVRESGVSCNDGLTRHVVQSYGVRQVDHTGQQPTDEYLRIPLRHRVLRALGLPSTKGMRRRAELAQIPQADRSMRRAAKRAINNWNALPPRRGEQKEFLKVNNISVARGWDPGHFRDGLILDLDRNHYLHCIGEAMYQIVPKNSVTGAVVGQHGFHVPQPAPSQPDRSIQFPPPYEAAGFQIRADGQAVPSYDEDRQQRMARAAEQAQALRDSRESLDSRSR